MSVALGEGVCPFHGVVPVDGVDGVLVSPGDARIGEGVSVCDRPFLALTLILI